MRCALGTAPPEELHARALAQPHLDWERMLAEPELASPPPALEACTRRAVLASAPARASSCSTSAASARSSGGSRSRASRRSSCPAPGTADAILELDPAAVLVGNGPGDPAQLDGPVETVRELLGRVPLFGICLGHQLVGARARPARRSSSRSATAARTTPCA